MKTLPIYKKLESIEFFPFLSGTVYPSNSSHINTLDQCFCQDQKLWNEQNPNGKCYPQQLCSDCNLDLSGLCPQESDSTYPGV